MSITENGILFDGIIYHYNGASFPMNGKLVEAYEVLPELSSKLLYMELCCFCVRTVPFDFFARCFKLNSGHTMYGYVPQASRLPIGYVQDKGGLVRVVDNRYTVRVTDSIVSLQVDNNVFAQALVSPMGPERALLDKYMGGSGNVQTLYVRYLFAMFRVKSDVTFVDGEYKCLVKGVIV